MIIPVYNTEKYLKRCLESLVRQTIDMSLVEVLLINDGSTDNSFQIMQEFAEKYDNFFLVNRQNGGVSKARNYGIMHAKGKYLFYLDSDDTISPNTIEDVTDFFDKYYNQVDIVTYKIVPVANGRPLPLHHRYRYLTDSGVYNLSHKKNYYISQTTMNICVKNKYDQNILFDEEMEIVLRKFRMKDETLRFMAYIKSAIFNWLEQPTLYMIKNGDFDNKIIIPLKKSAWSYYKAKTETNNFWLFDLELNLQNLDSLEFLVDISGNIYETYYYFMNELHFSMLYKRYSYIENGFSCSYRKGIFYFKRAEREDVRKQNRVLRQKGNLNWKVFLSRNLFLMRRKKYENIWLYMDCKGVEKDNAYYQFIHDLEINDGITRFYIHRHDKDTIHRLFTKKQQKYLVRYNSIKHRYLHFQARKIITAYVEWETAAHSLITGTGLM